MNKSILSAIALAFAFAIPASAQDGLLKNMHSDCLLHDITCAIVLTRRLRLTASSTRSRGLKLPIQNRLSTSVATDFLSQFTTPRLE